MAHKSIAEITAKAFAQTGPLSRLVKNYTPNPVQIQYAERVAQVFESGSKDKTSIGLLEAGTGIGNPLGYAIPLLAYAALSGNKIAISAYTTQLQSQLLSVGGDIDVAKQVIYELTGKSLLVAPRLGIRNFVSPLRIRKAMAEKNITIANTPDSVKKFLHWADTSESGAFIEWNRLHGEIPSEFSISEICCEQYLSDTDMQRYLAHRDHAKSADVIITNHELMLLHTLSRNYSVLDETESHPLSIIVSDEADKIEFAAQLISNRSTALLSIRALFSQYADPNYKAIARRIKSISDLARRLDSEKSHINLLDDQGIATEIDEQITKLLPLFDRALKSCSDEELRAEITLHKNALGSFKPTFRTPLGK